MVSPDFEQWDSCLRRVDEYEDPDNQRVRTSKSFPINACNSYLSLESMGAFKFFTVEKSEGLLSFTLLFAAGRQHYVAARVAFRNGLIETGSLLAEQSLELLIKSIMKLHHEKKEVHDLIPLLQLGKNKIPYFQKILNDRRMTYFLHNLKEAYKFMRYGEAKYSIDSTQVIQLLDELAYNLSKTYLEVIQSPTETQLYVPDKLEEDLLRENKFFTKNTITSNPMAAIGMPGVDFKQMPDIRKLVAKRALSMTDSH